MQLCIISDISFDEFFAWSESCCKLRRYTKTLIFKDKPKHKEYRHCFGNRVVSIWNSLLKTVVSANSFSVFYKTQFDLHKKKQFDLHNAANLMF